MPGPVTTLYRAKAKEGVRFRGLDLSRSEEAAARRILRQAGREHAEVTVRGAFAEDELAAQAGGEGLTPAVLLGTRSRDRAPRAPSPTSGSCRPGSAWSPSVRTRPRRCRRRQKRCRPLSAW